MTRSLKSVLLLVFVLLTCLAFFGAASAETQLIKAEGFVVKTGVETGDGAAKKAALEDAFTNAVAEAIKLFADEDTISELAGRLEREIYPKTKKYVMNYRILSSGWITHFDLPEAVVTPGTKTSAEEVDDTPGEEGASGGMEEDVLPTRGGVNAYHIWIEASVDVGKLRGVVKKFTSIEEEKTTEVTVVIIDVEDYSVFEDLKDRLMKIDIVKDVSYRSISGNKYVLSALTAGTGHTLYERLSKELGGEFVLMPGGAEKVIIKAERRGM